ncbi:MAG: hypothetical protein HYV41_01595 [Candidatus Magasanikbacteria bacterium]|nr:hypothetical protein [Candidatus Magasanikbacteria bacterium]
MPRKKQEEQLMEEAPIVSATQTQTQVVSITRTKMGIAVAFLGFAAVAAAAAGGLSGSNCISNKTTLVDNGSVRVCEQEKMINKWAPDYAFVVSKYTSLNVRLIVKDPEQWIVSDGFNTSTAVESPTSVMIDQGKSKVFMLKDGGMNMVLTYKGMYKNYALFNVEINVGGGMQSGCTDSDGGLDYYVKGTTYGPNIDNTDFCSYGSGGGLQENYCKNDTQVMDYYECPNGCVDGACITSSTMPVATTTSAVSYSCVDSDGGENLFVKGTVTASSSASNYVGVHTDKCSSEFLPANNYVEENVCNDNYGKLGNNTPLVKLLIQECPNGMICSDGACLVSSSTLPIVTSTPITSSTQSIICTPGEVVKDCINANGVDYTTFSFSHICNAQGTGYITDSTKCYPTGVCQEGVCVPTQSPSSTSSST